MLALSQYELASPSVAAEGTCVPLTWLLAVAGWCNARLVFVPIPLPVKEIEVGLLFALLVTVTAPVRVPEVVGVNRTVMVQEALTAKVEQLLV